MVWNVLLAVSQGCRQLFDAMCLLICKTVCWLRRDVTGLRKGNDIWLLASYEAARLELMSAQRLCATDGAVKLQHGLSHLFNRSWQLEVRVSTLVNSCVVSFFFLVFNTAQKHKLSLQRVFLFIFSRQQQCLVKQQKRSRSPSRRCSSLKWRLVRMFWLPHLHAVMIYDKVGCWIFRAFVKLPQLREEKIVTGILDSSLAGRTLS